MIKDRPVNPHQHPAIFFQPLFLDLTVLLDADAISIGYVCGDTVDKAYQEFAQGKGGAAAAKMGFDVLLWQSLASVAIPGLTINLAASKKCENGRTIEQGAHFWGGGGVGA